MDELFEDQINVDLDGIQLIDFDMDSIDKDSIDDAHELVENLSKLYCDEEFIKNHPSFKKRIDTELESLRVLIKMRKTDERAHDLIINAIVGNSGNASLYKSLTEIQKTIISITTKIDEIIKGLNTLLKGYQLELNFDAQPQDNSDESTEEGLKNTYRGSKEFIEDMMEEEMFENEKEPS